MLPVAVPETSPVRTDDTGAVPDEGDAESATLKLCALTVKLNCVVRLMPPPVPVTVIV